MPPEGAATPASARKWTSSNGKFSVEAELVEVNDGSVRLKRQDGKIISVPVSKLSKVDRNYLAAIAKAKRKPEATKATPTEVVAAIKRLGGKVELDAKGAVVRVILKRAKVTDKAMKHLKGLTELRSLDLADALITDDGLEQLKGLTKINRLYLNGTDVTDAGLEHLKAMKDLKILDLFESRVTNPGLDHLKGLTKLTSLELRRTRVTFEGVKKLRQALPECSVRYSR